MGSVGQGDNFNEILNKPGTSRDGGDLASFKREPQFMEFSDDVLLCILKHCTPQTLKALGYTCSRLGVLVCDYTLWQHVDARSAPTGEERMTWYLTHGLSSATKILKLTGYVDRYTRCLGTKNPPETGTWDPCEDKNKSNPQSSPSNTSDTKNAQPKTKAKDKKTPLKSLIQLAYQSVVGESKPSTSGKSGNSSQNPSTSCQNSNNSGASTSNSGAAPSRAGRPDPKSMRRSNSNLIALLMSNSSMSNIEDEVECMVLHRHGPQFTLNLRLLRSLTSTCVNLTTLMLEYCNLDDKHTSLGFFPHKLKKLSLKGSWCYNVPEHSTYLHRIQYRLPQLEYLDVSECDWFDGTSLISISKLQCLRELYMKHCRRLTECVEYASLAARQGFKRLRIVDMRGSPVGDPEVSAFGWLPDLEELYCSPPLKSAFMPEPGQRHKCGDVTEPFSELEPWEKEVPYYYKEKALAPDYIEKEEEFEEWVPCPEDRSSRHLRRRQTQNEFRLYYDILPHQDVNPNSRGCKRSLSAEQTECIKRLRQRIEKYRQRTNADEILARLNNVQQLDGLFMPEPSNNGRPSNAGPSNGRPSNAGPSKGRPSKAGKSNGRPSNSGRPSSAGPSYGRSSNAGPSNAGPSNAGPSNAGPSNAGPSNAGPSNAGPSNCRPVYAGPSNAGPSNAGPSNAGPSNAGPSNCRPVYAGPSNAGTSKGRPGNAGPSNGRPNNDAELEPVAGPSGANDFQPNNPRPAADDDAVGNEVDHRLGRYLRRLYLPALLRGERQPLVQFFFQPHFVYYLVSDMAVLGFGRAKHDLIHQLMMAHHIPGQELAVRPYQSNLRVLSITGYRDVTNRSLEHLARAAPYLRRIDFSHTRVTMAGVEAFKVQRPNCEVIFCEMTNE